MTRIWALVIGLLLLSGPSAGAAQAPGKATVRAVVGPVTVIHDGSAKRRPVAVGDALQDADRLQGGGMDASAQIDCPNGATQTLTGPFDAILNPSGSQTPCAIDLNAGTAVATTAHTASGDDEPDSASITSGAIAMTAHHTQFGFDAGPPVTKKMLAVKAAGQTRGFVLDGSASCRDVASGRLWTLEAGKQIDVRTREISAVSDTSYLRLATAFAKLDLSQKGAPAANPEAEKSLQVRWLAVMQKPQDAAARVNLAETQASFKVASHTSVYQAHRANVLVQKSSDPALKARLLKMNVGARIGANEVIRPNAPAKPAVQ